ncbi:hypothetical protein GGU10DRAFT_390658 [Lentinula aff. detonsa]|uniref:Uncharacterized protein n=1 Tax=Lentinula aff. detonsa TaxID=2804958 RepID=A0AA38KP23_9AGAR|nr:hypothetical protein GGU10DRAFT_390658 [Lentinula aff. detonsa]
MYEAQWLESPTVRLSVCTLFSGSGTVDSGERNQRFSSPQSKSAGLGIVAACIALSVGNVDVVFCSI